jgi:hypothetical protein
MMLDFRQAISGSEDMLFENLQSLGILINMIADKLKELMIWWSFIRVIMFFTNLECPPFVKLYGISLRRS